MNAMLQLLRSRWARLLFFLNLSAVLTLLMLQPALHGRELTLAFIHLALVLPLLWGGIFAALLHDALHRPLAFLLPNFGPRVLPAYVALAVGFALACGWAGYAFVPEIPLLTICTLAAVAFSFCLPLEPGWRWAGSRILFVTNVGGALLIYEFGEQLRVLLTAAPVATAVAALAFTALCFRVTFSRERRRGRALEPYTSSFSALFSTPLTRRRTQEKLARKDTSHLAWSAPARCGTLSWWLAALRHERANEWGRLGWFGTVLFVSLGAHLGLAAVSKIDDGFAGRILALATNASNARGTSLGSILLMQVLLTPLPRSGWLYPLSRAERTRVTFLSFALHLGIACVIFTCTGPILGLAAAEWLGRDFVWTGYATLLAQLASMLPLAPLVLWARLHRDVRDTSAWLVFMVVACLFAGPGLVAVQWGATYVTPDMLSWRGIARCTALTVVSQALLFAALRRFHRRGDLVQRGSSEMSLGLV